MARASVPAKIYVFCGSRRWVGQIGSIAPSTDEPQRQVLPTCTKIGTHMYHPQLHKKVSWGHRPNSTGSRTFWILWSFLAFRMCHILTHSYRIRQVSLKISVYPIDEWVITSYEHLLLMLEYVVTGES